MRNIHTTFCPFLTIVVGLCTSEVLWAATYTVPGSYQDLQDAVYAAFSNGDTTDTIKVRYDYVHTAPLWIGADAQNLTICSFDQTFTSPQAGAQVARLDIGVTNCSIVIDGFVIDSSSVDLGAVRIFHPNYPWDNTVSTDSCYQILNCDLTAQSDDRGVYLFPSTNNSSLLMENSTVHDCYAINIESASATLIKDCLLQGMADSGVIYANAAATTGQHRIVDCTFDAIGVYGVITWTPLNDLDIEGTTIQNVGSCALLFNSSVNLDLENCTLQSNVQPNCDGVFLNQGASGSSLNFSNVTVRNFTRHGINIDPYVNGTFDHCKWEYNGACGFNKWNLNGDTVSTLAFSWCDAIHNGGDGYCFAAPVSAAFSMCVMDFNDNCGIMKTGDNNGYPLVPSIVSMAGCLVQNNGGCGVKGIDSSQDWVLSYCAFKNNVQMGMYLENNVSGGQCDLSLTKSSFDGHYNQSYASIYLKNVGVYGAQANSSELINCVFNEGLYNVELDNSAVDILHCTFTTYAHSTVPLPTKASVHINSGACRLRNSILDGAVISVDAYSNPQFEATYNIINGIVVGTSADDESNFQAVPDFVVPPTGSATGDMHLLGSSPALAAGTDLGITTDKDNNSRPYPEITPDLGAYESSEDRVECFIFQ